MAPPACLAESMSGLEWKINTFMSKGVRTYVLVAYAMLFLQPWHCPQLTTALQHLDPSQTRLLRPRRNNGTPRIFSYTIRPLTISTAAMLLCYCDLVLSSYI